MAVAAAALPEAAEAVGTEGGAAEAASSASSPTKSATRSRSSATRSSSSPPFNLPRTAIPSHLRGSGVLSRGIAAIAAGTLALLFMSYAFGQYFNFDWSQLAAKPLSVPKTPYSGLYTGQLDALQRIENPQAAVVLSTAPPPPGSQQTATGVLL